MQQAATGNIFLNKIEKIYIYYIYNVNYKLYLRLIAYKQFALSVRYIT